MYKQNGIMQQSTIDSALASVRYATLEEARAGARELLRDACVLRAMIVWNKILLALSSGSSGDLTGTLSRNAERSVAAPSRLTLTAEPRRRCGGNLTGGRPIGS
jgi:hypothetical protein